MTALEILLIITGCAGTAATILWIERDHTARRERMRAANWQRDFEWLRGNCLTRDWDEFIDGEGI